MMLTASDFVIDKWLLKPCFVTTTTGIRDIVGSEITF